MLILNKCVLVSRGCVGIERVCGVPAPESVTITTK